MPRSGVSLGDRTRCRRRVPSASGWSTRRPTDVKRAGVSGAASLVSSGRITPSAVPPTCPKQRFAAVIHGQQRSVAGGVELRQSWMPAAGQCFPSSRSFNTGSVCWGWRPVQPVSCSRAPSIRVVASRTSCRSSSVNSATRYSTIQAILGRSWIIHGVSRSPGAKSECVSCVSWVNRLPQVGHLGAGVVMPGSMVRVEVPVHLVRAGSAEHREPLVVGGHERSQRAGRSRRPPRLAPDNLDG